MRDYRFFPTEDLEKDCQKFQELIRINKKLLQKEAIDDFRGRLEISTWRHKQHAMLQELYMRFNDSPEMDDLITVLDELKICFFKPL
jgi:hypothetical protein